MRRELALKGCPPTSTLLPQHVYPNSIHNIKKKKKVLFEQAFFKKYLSNPLYYSYLVVTAVEESKLSHNLTGSLSSISSLAHLSQCV